MTRGQKTLQNFNPMHPLLAHFIVVFTERSGSKLFISKLEGMKQDHKMPPSLGLKWINEGVSFLFTCLPENFLVITQILTEGDKII